MREIIDRYVKERIKGDKVYLKDFYEVYCAIEVWHDRTPISKYMYRSCFYLFFRMLYRIIIRTSYVYHMSYDLGNMLVEPINKAKGWFKFYWRKDWKKYKNSNVYGFTPMEGTASYGHLGLLAWLKEIRLSNDIKWLEKIDKFYLEEENFDDEY